MKNIFLTFILLFSLQAKAINFTSFFCPFLEGVPLPFCANPKYHTCNSGYAETATYNQIQEIIKTVDSPSMDTCAQNNVVCTTECTTGPDGKSCSQSCQCTSPVPHPNNCHTVCDICQSNVILDMGVYCTWHCGEPSHFPDSISNVVNGVSLVYGHVGPQTPTCTGAQVQTCAAGTGTGGPTDLSSCPDPAANVKPFSVTDPKGECCYTNATGAKYVPKACAK